jgi:hypothetical protein
VHSSPPARARTGTGTRTWTSTQTRTRTKDKDKDKDKNKNKSKSKNENENKNKNKSKNKSKNEYKNKNMNKHKHKTKHKNKGREEIKGKWRRIMDWGSDSREKILVESVYKKVKPKTPSCYPVPPPFLPVESALVESMNPDQRRSRLGLRVED